MKSRILLFFSLLCVLPCTAEESTGSTLKIFHTDPPPASYGSNIYVSIEPAGSEGEIYFRFAASPQQHFVRYRSPLELSAVQGEERRYRLSLQLIKDGVIIDEEEVSYTIDKRPPAVPELDPPPGVYSEEIEIRFKNAGLSEINYKLDAQELRNFSSWSGYGIGLLCPPGHRKTYTVYAYASDQAGNTSRIVSGDYVINRIDYRQSEKKPQIYSPVPGNFANKQFCYIHNLSGFKAYYSLNGEDPKQNGTRYTEPFLIDKTGSVSLSIDIYDKKDNAVESRTIEYSCSDRELDIPPSGFIGNELPVLLMNENDYRYTLEERSPLLSDPQPSDDLVLEPVKGIARPISFRITKFQQMNSKADYDEFRYFFILDGRTPIQPLIALDKQEPVNSAVKINLMSSPETLIYYTLDGSQPDASSLLYTGPFSYNPPDGKEGTLTVKARAFHKNGLKSDISVHEIRFDTLVPEKPAVSYRSREDNTVVVQVANRGEEQVRFEITSDGSPVPLPDMSSSLMEKDLVFDVPYGMEAAFSVRCGFFDEAGNAGEVSEAITFAVDHLPPETAQIFLQGDKVELSGEGNIFYTISADHESVSESFTGYKPYTGPFTLNGLSSEIVAYTVRAFTRDKNGNTSGDIITLHTDIDKRVPILPPLKGIEDGGLYTEEFIEGTFVSDIPDLRIYYEISEGSVITEPSLSSSWTNKKVTISTEEGKETDYTLTLLPVIYPEKDSIIAHEKRGGITSIRFAVDRKPPSVPIVRGIRSGAVYNSPVNIRLEAGDPSDYLYFNYTERTEASSVTAYPDGYLYNGPFTIKVPEGEKKTFLFTASSVDKAGNMTKIENPIGFLIDRSKPPMPEIEISGSGSIINRNGQYISNLPVTLTFQPNTASVYYTLSTKGSTSEPPSAGSKRYIEPIIFEGSSNTETEYVIRAVSAADADNLGEETGPISIIIDRQAPAEPLEPDTVKSRDRDKPGFFSWVVPSGQSYYYRFLQGALSKDDGSFVKYNNPVEFLWRGETISIEYYAEDSAGNRSKYRRTELQSIPRISEPAFSGAEHTGLYKKGVTLINENSGTVHYELTTDPEAMPEVSLLSPIMNRELAFSGIEGESVTFFIHAKKYYQDIPSKSILFYFTIDRKAPEKPVIRINDNPDSSTVTMELQAAEGRIFYQYGQYASNGKYREPVNYSQLIPYTGSVTVDTKQLLPGNYTITAVSRDRAGNYSAETRKTVFLDAQVVYIDPASEENEQDGSRDKPYKTLNDAAASAYGSDKNTLFLAEGSYVVSSPLELDGFSLIAGFDSGDWTGQGSRSTTILQFTADSGYLLNAGKKGFRISNCTLKNNSNSCGGLLHIEEGELLVENVSFVPSAGAAVIESRSGIVHLNNTELNTGNLSKESIGILLNDSKLYLRSSVLKGTRSGHINTLISAVRSSVEISDSELHLDAEFGSTGIYAFESNLLLTDNIFHGSYSPDFMNALHLRRCEAQIYTNNIIESGSNNMYAAIMMNTVSSWINNSVILSKGKHRTVGLYITGETGSHYLFNNALHAASGINSTAIISEAAVTELELHSNGFQGWEDLLTVPSGSYSDGGELNSFDEDPLGGVFNANLSLSDNAAAIEIDADMRIRLTPTSPYIDAGTDVGIFGGPVLDFDKQNRPLPGSGTSEARYDIGSDEYSIFN